ncbi:MAG: phosphatase PAP2 family protein [Cyclobacteriaceae bacterium]|nr:phosphatase PAP2 family protein [Cyclobacteriaceae bacterium]
MQLNKIYTYPGMLLYYLLLITGAFILFLSEKGDWVIWLSRNGSALFDRFFIYWTYLGDGLVFVVLIVVFIFRDYVFLFITILAAIIQTVFVQGLKRFIFSGLVRPRLFFEDFGTFRQIEGIEFYSNNAFPSGHTATAFTCALILSLYLRDKRWSVLLILAAVLVGISRIYLMQHFFVDVYFGSIFGMVSVILSAYIMLGNKYIHGNFSGRSLLSGR